MLPKWKITLVMFLNFKSKLTCIMLWSSQPPFVCKATIFVFKINKLTLREWKRLVLVYKTCKCWKRHLSQFLWWRIYFSSNVETTSGSLSGFKSWLCSLLSFWSWSQNLGSFQNPHVLMEVNDSIDLIEFCKD